MTHVFNNTTHIPNGESYVCDLATDHAEQRGPVLLKVTRNHVTAVWKVEWHDQAGVIKRFNEEKEQYLKVMELCSYGDVNENSELVIGRP